MAINSDFDHKLISIFGDISIDKAAVRDLKIRDARTITSFVEEWLVSRYQQPGKSNAQVYADITDFMSKHLPTKNEKQTIKHRLNQGESIVLLDRFTVSVDIKKKQSFIKIPCLDENNAVVDNGVLDANPGLLSGGQWGAGRLYVRPEGNAHIIELVEFKPMQSGQVRLDNIIEARQQFSTQEWIHVLLRTMGYEPSAYSEAEQCRIILRLLPLVQKNLNMMELAPKGTGKSFIYDNLSRHVWLTTGKLSRAQLFKNLNTKEEGLLARFDVLVLDEGQSLEFTGSGDIHANFKNYLESGHYSIGQDKVTSECGLMLLANIDLSSNKQPRRPDYIRHLPEMFHDDALMDRFHGIIPGWEIPRFRTEHAAQGPGIKADVFGEYANQIRIAGHYELPYGEVPILKGDTRDKNAVERLAKALSKLLMLNPDDAEYENYVLHPAMDLRKRVRTQLAELNPHEFSAALDVSISA
ncbi:BREX system Lon protease-like protein BrxL [Candidatus Venteria ishoeyi]|uniref:BREX system Lon protease-like BrxL N-terminal domain-containing protein n=1 Tax=Candidatus Venteria ishoeyi TaxID=1899563 RepID=A0A1H6FCX5_9GAMM|nr:BREX system Lon protease-like protein BrxL [Candidatus Venteria ishoeyi]MDM8545782.1 BREX system Lon protease-like protein BrxL [Candidatus Venteria ishoeyi]SEH06865.1 Uncharacterised protein [Candidatus Venteria ishoeyi]